MLKTIRLRTIRIYAQAFSSYKKGILNSTGLLAGRIEELNGSWWARLLFYTTLQRQTGRQKAALTHHPKGWCASLGNVVFTVIRLYERICIAFHMFISTNVARWMIIIGGPLPLVYGHISWDWPELGTLSLNEALQKHRVFRSKHTGKGEKIAHFPISRFWYSA